MRFILLGIVLTSGIFIGTRAINAVSDMQDAKMARFCKTIPVGASYDDICAKYK